MVPDLRYISNMTKYSKAQLIMFAPIPLISDALGISSGIKGQPVSTLKVVIEICIC